MQTGKLADEYITILKDHGLTIQKFCDLGCYEMYSPLSEDIHDKIKSPAHCLTWESFYEIFQNDAILKKYFEGHNHRVILAKTIFRLR